MPYPDYLKFSISWISEAPPVILYLKCSDIFRFCVGLCRRKKISCSSYEKYLGQKQKQNPFLFSFTLFVKNTCNKIWKQLSGSEFMSLFTESPGHSSVQFKLLWFFLKGAPERVHSGFSPIIYTKPVYFSKNNALYWK